VLLHDHPLAVSLAIDIRDPKRRVERLALGAAAFAKGPAGNKYEVELEGGTHMGFAGLLRDKDHRVQVFQCAQIETLAFWDAYLKQDPKARQYLDSNGLEKFSGDIARFAKK
jgi:hypothetical protein